MVALPTGAAVPAAGAPIRSDGGEAAAATSAAAAAHAAGPAPAWLTLFNRPIIEFRGVLTGLTPVERVARAQRRFAALTERQLTEPLHIRTLKIGGERGVAFQLGDATLFAHLESDLDPEGSLEFIEATERVRIALRAAIDARAEQGRPAVWARGLAKTLAALLVCVIGIWGAARIYQQLTAAGERATADANASLGSYLKVFALRALRVAVWGLVAVLFYLAGLYSLYAFPWTEPWAEQLANSMRGLGGGLALGALGAVPGLLAVALILLAARAVQEVVRLFLGHVQRGRVRVPFVHAETASATRRVLYVLIWGVAIAAAYPYLPGSDSHAFKGLSVLLGLMVTLGSSGLVTQLMSGLVVVYSRSIARGDFVAVGDVEGIVSEIGTLAVKIVNARHDVITIPHAVLASSPVRNYSRLAGESGALVSTRVTIGYDTPWRQVHAMLIAAASRTSGLRERPPPYVYQRSLGDFYVEYEVYAHIAHPGDRLAVLSALHASIQDQFNAHGVQIMSPHWVDQPAAPVLVPRERWHAPPAQPGDA